MNHSSSPLFSYGPEQVVAWHIDRPISAQQFLSDILYTAARLPASPYVLNLCDDRYHFMVGLAAAIINNKVTLLPPNGVTAVINGLAEEYTDIFCLTDKPLQGIDLQQLQITYNPEQVDIEQYEIPQIENERLVAILFTSGSTGRPKANLKFWGDLWKGTTQALTRFGIRQDKIKGIVATVPPQHMYGLETSILIPWFSAITVHSGCPLFPMDVHAALAALDSPRVLITTPIHLRACVNADLEWPDIDFLISATAPLSMDLACKTEQQLNTKVMEIYGCTEAGSIASRRTIEGEEWKLYDKMYFSQTDLSIMIHGPQLPLPISLNDHLELLELPYFKLRGRHTDMIKIAGKRASLADLNHKLSEIDGVVDGTFVMPDTNDHEVARLAALFVAPGLSKVELLKELAQKVDPAFLPRPLYKVEKLPRSNTGKLPREQVLQMVKALQQGQETEIDHTGMVDIYSTA